MNTKCFEVSKDGNKKRCLFSPGSACNVQVEGTDTGGDINAFGACTTANSLSSLGRNG